MDIKEYTSELRKRFRAKAFLPSGKTVKLLEGVLSFIEREYQKEDKEVLLAELEELLLIIKEMWFWDYPSSWKGINGMTVEELWKSLIDVAKEEKRNESVEKRLAFQNKLHYSVDIMSEVNALKGEIPVIMKLMGIK